MNNQLLDLKQITNKDIKALAAKYGSVSAFLKAT